MPDELIFDDDKPREACGVFGIFVSKDAGVAEDVDVTHLTYYGLYALQHRGQESAGIAVADGRNIHLHKNMGLVPEVFNEDILKRLNGHLAIGHVRYSTTGSSLLINAQPLVFGYLKGMLALAHNGNLTNANDLRQSLGETGSVFQSTTDSEVIVNLIARYNRNTLEDALMKCMIDIKGSYSLLLMTENQLIGMRDPFGNRPLCLGRLGSAYILASESCAIDTVGGEFIRDINPGEIIIIDERGINTIQSLRAPKGATCVFEFIYFARPDSDIDGVNVNRARHAMGRSLAREYKIDADIVIAVPDSGTAAAVGYAEESRIPFAEGLVKNRYIGRTFIQPAQKTRDLGVRLKLNPIKRVLAGQRVIMIDDSIVRGTTSGKIVKMLREAGVKEVHMLVSSPPILYPCYYGIDTSDRGQLIAAQQELEEIRCYINADSLHYLSHDGLCEAMQVGTENLCFACFTGNYPIEVPRIHPSKHVLESHSEEDIR